MIILSGVTKKYTSVIFENVNLKINKGEFVYVVGDSGAGKTTLLKMLYGEEHPNQGTIEILGQDILKANGSQIQNLRRKMGIIFQDLRLVEDLSVYENIALSLETAPAANITSSWKKLIDEFIEMLGLKNLTQKKVRNLSGGERQRVAVARAFVRRPEILIADEPAGSLDKNYTWRLMDLFQKFHFHGTTVVLATHDREIVRRVKRRSYIFKSSKLLVEDGICFL